RDLRSAPPDPALWPRVPEEPPGNGGDAEPGRGGRLPAPPRRAIPDGSGAMKPVHLRPGREPSLKARHPWIFSGAIREIPRDAVPDETVQVVTADGHAAAVGALSPASQIAVRVWSFDAGETIDAGFFRRRIEAALGRRATLPGCADTEALRLVNAESDGLPGLIVDRYGDFLVCQFLSAGAEFWRDTVAASLTELCAPRGIFERSDADVRQKEGL